MTSVAEAPADPMAVEAGLRRRRRTRTTRLVAGVLLVALVAVSIVVATRPSSQAARIASPLVGRQAPALTGTTLGGAPFSLGAQRGRYVYINFFASWCPPCQQEEPSLVNFRFHQQQSAAGAELVSVVFNDTVASARHFVDQWGASWPAVADHGGTIANRYGVESPPMTFLVNPHGTVVGAFAGPVTTSQLEGMLAAARTTQARHG